MSTAAADDREGWLSEFDTRSYEWKDLAVQKDGVHQNQEEDEPEDETLVDAMIAARWRCGTWGVNNEHSPMGMWKDVREDVEHAQRIRKDGRSLTRLEVDDEARRKREADLTAENGQERIVIERTRSDEAKEWMLAEKARELRDALALAETVQRENSFLRLALERVQVVSCSACPPCLIF